MVFLLSASPSVVAKPVPSPHLRLECLANRVVSVHTGEGGMEVLARLASTVGFAPPFLLFFSCHCSAVRPRRHSSQASLRANRPWRVPPGPPIPRLITASLRGSNPLIGCGDWYPPLGTRESRDCQILESHARCDDISPRRLLCIYSEMK